MATKKNGKGKRKPILNETVTYEPRGESGNAFWIVGAAVGKLRAAGLKDEAKRYQAEAFSGDYKHLLAVTRKYVNLKRV